MIKFATIGEAQRYADGPTVQVRTIRPKLIRAANGGIYVGELAEVQPGDEIIPPDAWIVLCGVCGAEDWMCPRVEEAWHPSAYRGDEEVSPVCPKHAGHYDAREQAFIVQEE